MIDEMPEGEFYRWVKAVDVLKLFPDRPRETAIKALAVRMGQGRLRTGAEEARIHGMPPLRYCFLHAAVWTHWLYDYDNDFWMTGDTSVPWGLDDDYHPSPSGNQLFDVRFEPDGLTQMGATFPTAPPSVVPLVAAASSEPRQTAGGRPPKAYWEPLLIEMARQLYVGDFKPDRQSDIEAAMHDWLTANGHAAGETQVRERARALFKALQG